MRANRAAAVAVTAGLALSGLAGCGATTQSGTGSTTSASATTAAPSTTLPLTSASLAVTPTTIQPPGHVGDTVQVPAAGQNPPAQVTLVKVVDPAQGADRFSQPVSGGRFVGVQLRITLGGTAPQFLDPNSDTILTDANGNLYQPIDANLVSCPAFNLGATVSPGTAVLGCVTFQVGFDAKVKEITFTPGGAFGNVSADWVVP
jgi:hypothetical protein